MITKDDYKFAFYSQSACNISGLVHDLVKVIEELWIEARDKGQGTEYVNTHPIVRLYAERIHFLSSKKDYNEAYQTCQTLGEVVE